MDDSLFIQFLIKLAQYNGIPWQLEHKTASEKAD